MLVSNTICILDNVRFTGTQRVSLLEQVITLTEYPSLPTVFSGQSLVFCIVF